jgi:5-formyltetrahydrofolate cyclo-ligase
VTDVPTFSGTSSAEAKAALRGRVLENRSLLDVRALSDAAHRLRDVLLAAPEIAAAGRIAAYVSVGREPGTGPLLEELSAREVEILLPILLPDGDLEWAPYTGPAGLVSATRGLLEPVAPALGSGAVTGADAVLVPALAVDRHGTRLGRGAGSFDRALARVAGRIFTCAVLHDGEILDMPVPRELHDVPVSAAATPAGLHRFR